MRRIGIVGADQSGLHLGLWLLGQGYEVTLLTDRTAADVLTGTVMSSQVMAGPALAHEREAGLDMWRDDTPQIPGMIMTVSVNGQPELTWVGRLSAPAQSVDQRLKFSRWISLFEQRGGTLEVRRPDIDDLERLHRDNDVVVVAASRGELADLFQPDPSRWPEQPPQRRLALAYLRDVTPDPRNLAHFVLVPGVGEMVLIPALSTSGPCHLAMIEAIPGGPMDVFGDVSEPDTRLARALDLVRRFAPWESERFATASLTDAGSTLVGAVAPKVCHPVASLPSGGWVLGMGEAVVRTDPLSAQGANNASHAAWRYGQSIIARGNASFTPQWAEEVFTRYWTGHAEPALRWTATLLAPPPHLPGLLAAAASNPQVADRIMSVFEHPDQVRWLLDPEQALATAVSSQAVSSPG